MPLLALRVPAAVGAAVVALSLVAAAAATVSPAKTKCPVVSLVDATLGQHDKAPTALTTTYAKICTYKGGGIVPTKIQFQVDTLSTFAAGEKAAAVTGALTKVKGLGKAAYGTKSGGFLAVLQGGESIRITAPLVSLVKLEKLARKLL